MSGNKFKLNWTFSLFILLFSLTCFAQNEEFIYDAKSKRDPFIPLVSSSGRLLNLDKEEVQGDDLIVEGIIYDKNGRSYAIVNAAVVGIGDVVGEYQVLKIEEKKVIFIREGQMREVEINREAEIDSQDAGDKVK